MASQPPPSPSLTRAQAWTLALAGMGSFLVALDLFAVSTALPRLRTDLHASVAALDWTVNAYTLSFAVLLMSAAALGDRWGRRAVYAGGLSLFAVSSIACALAPDAATLIAARAVQGAGAAVIMSLALALLNAAFPPQRRGWAMGIYGAITGLATVLGPTLGGALTQTLSWPWIFWINVPISLATAVAVLRRVEESLGTQHPIDVPGLILVTTSALGIVWAIIRAATTGWDKRPVIAALAAGILALAALLAWQRHARHPMIPLRLFTTRAFSTGNAGIFLLNASLAATVFFTAQFFQDAQDNTPLTGGLHLLPWGLVPLLIAPRAGAAADRLGPRPLIVAGLTLQAGGTATLAWLATPHQPYLVLISPMLGVGIGFSLAIPALTKTVVGSVEAADIGTASGLFTTLRQLGGAFGVAVTSAAFTAAGSYRSPSDFADGYRAAILLAATLALLGALTTLATPRQQALPAPLDTPAAARG